MCSAAPGQLRAADRLLRRPRRTGQTVRRRRRQVGFTSSTSTARRRACCSTCRSFSASSPRRPSRLRWAAASATTARSRSFRRGASRVVIGTRAFEDWDWFHKVVHPPGWEAASPSASTRARAKPPCAAGRRHRSKRRRRRSRRRQLAPRRHHLTPTSRATACSLARTWTRSVPSPSCPSCRSLRPAACDRGRPRRRAAPLAPSHRWHHHRPRDLRGQLDLARRFRLVEAGPVA